MAIVNPLGINNETIIEIIDFMNDPKFNPKNQSKYFFDDSMSYYQQLCKVSKLLADFQQAFGTVYQNEVNLANSISGFVSEEELNTAISDLQTFLQEQITAIEGGLANKLEDVVITGDVTVVSKSTEDGVETIEVAVQSGAGGTVTQVNAGEGLIGGTITSSGTLSVDPSVVAFLSALSSVASTGSYNDLTNKPIIPANIVDGENGSIHQINATNIGSNSVAYGTSISGSKAFSVSQLNSDKKTFVFDSIQDIEVGMEGNLYINDGTTDNNYMMFGLVESINGNNVTFDNAIAWDGNLNLQDSYIWFSSHPELGNITIGNGALAEGFNTNAVQIGAHSEGIDTIALAKYSHAEGRGSTAGGYCSHAEGRDTVTKGMYAFASGRASEGNGDYSFAGIQGKANGNNSLAIGTSVEANGNYSIAMGHGSKANGNESVAIGQNNTSSNNYAVAMGYGNTANGNGSFALGKNNETDAEGALATGIGTLADGYASATFGTGTSASGSRAIATGYNTVASGTTSLAGGSTTMAQHSSAIAFGTRCKTSRNEQVVFGIDNADNTNALFIIGDGTNENNKHNAFEVTSNSIKVGNTTVTETQLGSIIPSTYTNIPVAVTPTSMGNFNAWDTQQKYGYKADISINGITPNSLIWNIIMTDTILDSIAPIITTGVNKITVYTADATALSGTIYTLITRKV